MERDAGFLQRAPHVVAPTDYRWWDSHNGLPFGTAPTDGPYDAATRPQAEATSH